MDRLRSSLLELNGLEARQEVEDLLAAGEPLQEILSTLNAGATCARDLVFLYSLDRIVPDLSRLDLLLEGLQYVVDVRCAKKSTPVEPIDDGAADVAGLPHDLERGDAASAARGLRALENQGTEKAVRTALLDTVRGLDGPFGSALVDAVAFLRCFERSDGHDRAVVAHAYALDLVGRARPAANEGATESPAPLPGSPSAGELLAHLRAFHASAADACLEALVSGGRDEEALTVLLTRAEENAGPNARNLLFADAIRESFAHHGDARDELLAELARRLLHPETSSPIVERLADGVGSDPLTSGERTTHTEQLTTAIARRDKTDALTTASALLADEDGADRVRRAVLTNVFKLADAHAPLAFITVATLLSIARSVGWPAARASILRAVHLITVEREP